MTPKGHESLGGLFTDKVLTDLVLTDLVLGAAGLPQAKVRALAAPFRPQMPYRVLTGAAEIAGFLGEPGPLPVFGKPVHSSRGLGAISIVGQTEDRLLLGDGRAVLPSTLAAEIDSAFPDGYLFQDLMLPHPALAAIIGPVIGSVRIVTLRVGGEIKPLYAAIKMPRAGQMVDLAVSVQALFRRQESLKPDIALTPDGPKITAVNRNPSHGLYQKSFARGFMNAEIAPQISAVLAEFGHQKPTRALRYQ